ncbi:hypothetical protein [Pseudoalteromonas sp. MMG024]|uniref:hypothetical protein n=1 Tax=Pseudoalteromonas sp. MMG024 TaxID=2909980 RepID=UPI001F245448|nr:hypothetical protein [Pseudoalteromonas sp. MMG024]MCF6455884.1 hypothetical protein [Pseudoalteromonas sp. MMG024]
MNKFRVLLVPAAGLIGALLGYFLAPPQPLYPFAGEKHELELIYYIELHIIIYLGFFSACFTFLSSKLLKTSISLAIGSLISVGLFICAVDDLRSGAIPYYSFREIVAYVIGCISWYGIVYLLSSFFNKNKVV